MPVSVDTPLPCVHLARPHGFHVFDWDAFFDGVKNRLLHGRLNQRRAILPALAAPVTGGADRFDYWHGPYHI